MTQQNFCAWVSSFSFYYSVISIYKHLMYFCTKMYIFNFLLNFEEMFLQELFSISSNVFLWMYIFRDLILYNYIRRPFCTSSVKNFVSKTVYCCLILCLLLTSVMVLPSVSLKVGLFLCLGGVYHFVDPIFKNRHARENGRYALEGRGAAVGGLTDFDTRDKPRIVFVLQNIFKNEKHYKLNLYRDTCGKCHTWEIYLM